MSDFLAINKYQRIMPTKLIQILKSFILLNHIKDPLIVSLVVFKPVSHTSLFDGEKIKDKVYQSTLILHILH